MGTRGSPGFRSSAAHKIPAVHDGHVEVEKNHSRINTLATEEERLRAALCPDRAPTLEAKEIDQPLAQHGVVIDDQNVGT